MNFQQLLQRSGFDQYQNLFGDSSLVAKTLGFTGEQAENFSQFFQTFDRDRFMEAAGKIPENLARRLGKVEEGFESGYSGLTGRLGQATQKIQDASGRSGATFGATKKQISQASEKAGQTLQDLLGRRESGMFAAEQQEGRERAGLTSLLQNYVTGTFGRAQDIFALDPTGDDTLTTSTAGGGASGGKGLYSNTSPTQGNIFSNINTSSTGMGNIDNSILRNPYFYEQNPLG